jgi:hypothetical protein
MTERAYLDELVKALRGVLADDLLGVYAGGSWALGGYEPGRSDLDVAAVVRFPLAGEAKRAVVGAARHEALPCPARGLELVVYEQAAVGEPTAAATFELNLNTGARMAFRADEAPVPGELHWFALDRAILREHGVALLGPPPAEVFAEIPRELLLPVLADVLRWYREDGDRYDAVLNACRALLFAEEGRWASKQAAGRWALGRLGDDELAAGALRQEPLDRAHVGAFLTWSVARLEAHGARQDPTPG